MRFRFSLPYAYPRAVSAIAFAAALALTGCAASFSNSVPPSSVSGAAIKGSVHGGQAPIAGAAVYLFAASTSGYGSANTSLLKTSVPGVSTDGNGNGFVLTDNFGGFSITKDYDCPSPDALIYLVSIGGNPGLSGNVSNPAAAAIALLGACSGLSASTYINVNELTTIAAIYAVAPFTSTTTNAIATSPSNVAGLTNAFTLANNLVNVATGTANTKTPGGLGTIPASEINTLGDILAVCVNSDGTGNPCANLFSWTTPPGGSAPTNVIQAALNIALYPAQHVADLYTSVPATPPFQRTLPAVYNDFTQRYDGQPNDWTLAITYTNSHLTGNSYLAIDSQNNIWISDTSSTLTQLTNAGALRHFVPQPSDSSQFTNQNYDQVLAIDQSDNVWVDNNSYGVSEVSKDGVVLSAGAARWGYEPGYGTNNDFSNDLVAGYGGLAFDGVGHIWIGSASNANSGVVKADLNGYALNFYQNGGIVNPIFVAVDPQGNIWTANQGGSCCDPRSVTELNPTTGLYLSGASGYTAGGLNRPSAIAFDAASNAWVTNSGSNSLTKLTSSGVAFAGSPFTGGGLSFPSDAAIDGGGHVWVSNFTASGVSEFDGSTGAALSPAKGFYRGATGNDQGAVAIDGSGNVWTSSFAGYVSELVGAGVPTVNPVVVATKNGTIGTKP